MTTPLLSDDAGRTRLDSELLLAAYPWVSRPALRRFVVPTVIARYHDRRSVLRDVAANLIKERLEPWIEPADRRLGAVSGASRSTPRRSAVTTARTRACGSGSSASAAATAAGTGCAGRTYPFLIPGQIER